MPMETFYDLSLATRKLCSDAVYKDEKQKELLVEYYNSLTDTEKGNFDGYSECFWGFAKRGVKKYKISKNAIRLVARIKKELNVSCYPFIEKIATKGWGTSGGTFSWSIRTLKIKHEIFSFDPVSECLKKNSKMSIGSYNGFTTVDVEE